MSIDGGHRLSGPVEPPETETIRILHVDDDPAARDVTKTWLESEHDWATVTSVATPTEGLDALDEDHVDCIVSDYDMPDIDGLEFLWAVRARDPDIPFILFTGKGTEDVAAEAISAGVTDYVKKTGTGSYTLLANEIERSVNEYRVENVVGRRLRAMETAREGIALLDEDGDFIFVNQAYADMYGYEPAELLAEHWEVLYSERGARQLREDILPVVPETGRWSGEVTQVRTDGSTIRVSQALAYADNGTMICVAFDISNDREASRLLAEERERFDLLIEAITEYAIFSMDVDGNITTWNSGSERINGYRQEEIIGKDISILYTPEDVADGVPEAHLQQARTEGSVHELGWRTRRGDFKYWADFTLTPVDDEDGDHRGFVCVIRDMTEWLERERELQERVRQLDMFAGVLSHDLRNPLSTAKMSLDLAESDPEGAADHIARADRALDRIDELVESLLTLARQGKTVSDFQTVSLTDCARRAWDEIPAAEATLDIEEGTESVQGDGERIQTLFENLFGNAITHAGDDVTVRVGQAADHFFVEDDGPGIPPDERETVFDYGYSTCDEGSGFGLSIVRNIAVAHHWEVVLTEAESGGARFEFHGLAGEECES